MKRYLTSIAAVLLALGVLAGCASAGMTRGTIEGNVYTNESAGLTFTAPEKWTYYTDQEIAKILGTGADIIGESRAELSNETFKKINIYDMMAVEHATGTSVAIMYQSLAAADDGIYLYEVTYFDLLKAKINQVTLNCEFSNYTDIKIGSNTFLAMTIIYTDSGATQYYYIRRTGNYMICIVVTIPQGVDIDSVMENFS
jgi:hypothetical protein